MRAHVSGCRPFLRAAATGLSAIVILSPIAAHAAEPETLETVLAVWRKREAAAKTLKVVISEESTSSHGTGLEGEAIGGTRKGQRTIILDGINFRDEEQGEFTDPGSEVPQQLLMVAANDGNTTKRLTRVSLEKRLIRSIGDIDIGADRIEMQTRSPVILHWRALCPANEIFTLDGLKLISTEEKIGKLRCLLLHQPWGGRGGIEKFWVAPDQDMAILRRITTQPDRLTSQIDVTFKLDRKLGWVPASWTRKSYKQDGSIGQTKKATVVSTELNPDVLKETFDIAWPPGTTVYDLVKRDKFYVPGTGKPK